MTKSLITKKDLSKIISDAKSNMSKISLPLYISEKEVDQGELVAVAYIESMIMYFNVKKLLTTLPEIDYTDPACDHDPELPLESITKG